MNANWEAMPPISGTILVVEDDPIIRLLLSNILSELGAQSASFATADDALTYLQAPHAFCPMVIVDYGLPGKIQGAEFLSMVRNQWPCTRAILTSGYALDPESLPSQTVYLEKPWSPDQLVACIAAVLQLQPNHPLPLIVQPD
ncbi:response regulator [Pseudomonas koreensis]|uniref:response regulator n=1 Tax=Pseudomonas koreensis TaxID=198620 RepID=UPI00243436CD|nr:response regulator [Pseudomonas koreensis]